MLRHRDLMISSIEDELIALSKKVDKLIALMGAKFRARPSSRKRD